MRCPDCQKFVSLENGDPETNSLEVEDTDDGAIVTAEVHLIRNCGDCGTELKAADVEGDEDIQFDNLHCPAKNGDDTSHDLVVTELSCDVDESGGGRYKKNIITFDLEFKIACNDCDLEVKGNVRGDEAAGSFEESV